SCGGGLGFRGGEAVWEPTIRHAVVASAPPGVDQAMIEPSRITYRSPVTSCADQWSVSCSGVKPASRSLRAVSWTAWKAEGEAVTKAPRSCAVARAVRDGTAGEEDRADVVVIRSLNHRFPRTGACAAVCSHPPAAPPRRH